MRSAGCKEPCVRVRSGATSWNVLENSRDFLLGRLVPELDSDAHDARRTVVKDNPVRTVTRVDLRGGPTVYVKHYRYRRFMDRLLFSIVPQRSRARREWRILRELRARVPAVCVPTPIAVADTREGVMVCESRLVLEAIPDATPLGDMLLGKDLSPTERTRMLAQLAELTSRVVAAGLYHRDYHLGNMLVSRDGNSLRLAMIDLHSARMGRRCSRRQRDRMLAMMWRSLETCGVADEESIAFVRGVVDDDAQIGDVRRIVRKLTVRRWKSRTRRCVKDSSKFEQGRFRSGRYSVLRTFGRADLYRAVDIHKKGDGKSVTSLKKSTNGHVAAVHIEIGSTVCVKEVWATSFRKWMKTVFRRGRGRRAWIAVNGLAARRFPVPQPLGYVYECTGLTAATEYVVTDYREQSMSLQDYVETLAYTSLVLDRKRAFIRECARYVAGLHDRGVHQHDFKANNVLVEDTGSGDWTFYLVDLDSVRFVGRVSERRRVKNLTQLAAALSNTVSLAQRLRFLRIYAEVAGLNWNEKSVVGSIMRIARARGGPWKAHCLSERRPMNRR